VGFLKFSPLGAKVRVGVEHKLLVTWVLWFCATMCETVIRHIEYYSKFLNLVWWPVWFNIRVLDFNWVIKF
jgi:hypothetical protein